MRSLTHLERLEAESIHIFREVASEFQNPVMLYSVGKDSAVLLHLALKAFAPSKPPFPLLHVDTTWKFREMIEFRENYARKELGLDVLVYTNEEGRRLNIFIAVAARNFSCDCSINNNTLVFVCFG